jgi:hypothetical protein
MFTQHYHIITSGVSGFLLLLHAFAAHIGASQQSVPQEGERMPRSGLEPEPQRGVYTKVLLTHH